MKVLHVTGGTLRGGAAQGALRLHEGLLALGVDSYLYTDNSDGIESLNIIDGFSKLKKIKRHLNYQINQYIYRKCSTDVLFSGNKNYFSVLDRELYNDFDIINLHWCNYTFDLSDLKYLKARKPIVWTVRDMWAFTGGCHYSLTCMRFKKGCGACPALNHTNEVDITRSNFIEKKSIYQGVNFVAISEWLKNMMLKSNIVDRTNITTIYNSINLKDFHQIHRNENKTFNYVPFTNRTKILIGAVYINHPCKGGKYIKKFVEKYKDEYFFLFFGKGANEFYKEVSGIHYYDFGFVKTQKELSSIYSSADVFLMLSEQEAFGKTVIEALACSTPVIVFDNTAPAEIVKLCCLDSCVVAQGDIGGIKKAIELLTSISKDYSEVIKKNFSQELIAKKYLTLYQNIFTPHK